MSEKGIKKCAQIFSKMQELRIELIGEGHDPQDLKLATMLSKGKDAMKHDFSRITIEGCK